MLKTLKDKPKKPIFTTARVTEVGASKVSTSGNNMVTQFTLALNGPAAGEAQNGVKSFLIWNPIWFRPSFDIIALSTEVEKLSVLADQGDLDAAAQKKLFNSMLYTADNNIFGDETKNVPTLRGLIGGRDYDEHMALWGQFCGAVEELGAANPEQEDEAGEKAAQDAIIAGVDSFLTQFFGPESLAGKYVALSYGNKNEPVKTADGEPVYDTEGRRLYTPSKYRNIIRFVIPGAKTDMVKRLEWWKKYCEKPNAQMVYMVDDSEPFGSVPF